MTPTFLPVGSRSGVAQPWGMRRHRRYNDSGPPAKVVDPSVTDLRRSASRSDRARPGGACVEEGTHRCRATVG